jgi:hypothetical protein
MACWWAVLQACRLNTNLDEKLPFTLLQIDTKKKIGIQSGSV